MKRRTFVTGTSLAGLLALGGVSAETACAAPATPAADSLDGNVVPVARYDPTKGRWPDRASQVGMLWIDESGFAPKPPLVTGDIYLQASSAQASAMMASSGEVLSPAMTTFGTPWETKQSAQLVAGNGAKLTKSGDGLTLALVPVKPGHHVTFSVQCTSGDAIATIQFWDVHTHLGDVQASGGGHLKVTSVVPAGASAANLWLEFGKEPATFSTASFKDADA